MSKQSQSRICWIVDQRISGSETSALTEQISFLRPFFFMETVLWDGKSQLKWTDLVSKYPFDLILMPVSLYCSEDWNEKTGSDPEKVTFAGYLTSPLSMKNLPQPKSLKRQILLDLTNLQTTDVFRLLYSLTQPGARAGLTSLLKTKTAIYCENWHGIQGLEKRTDFLLGLSEISNSHWKNRKQSLQMIVFAFWKLIYDDRATQDESLKATFQVGADPGCLAFRLYFPAPQSSMAEIFKRFWLERNLEMKAPQILLQFSDFLRIQWIPESEEIDLVAGLFHSAPSEKNTDHINSFWIESIPSSWMVDSPFLVPGPNLPQFRPLPHFSISGPKLRILGDPDPHLKSSLPSSAPEASPQPTSAHPSPADLSPKHSSKEEAEILLESFQKKYFESKYEIRQIQLEIEALEKTGTVSLKNIQELHLKMEAQTNRLQVWLKKLLGPLKELKKSGKKPRKKR